MDRLEAMAMLVQVSDAGSFTAAARSLRVPLTTLSRKIAELESHVGARLLHRTTRKLTVTEAGSVYLASARRILEQVETAEREVSGEVTLPKGQLVVSAPIHFGRLHVVPLVADFLAELPEIDVRLMLTDRNVDLLDDHVDVAIRIGALRDSTMIATKVGSTRTVVCASPACLRRHGVPADPRELQQRPCVAVDASTAPFAWRFRRPGGGAVIDVPVTPRMSVTTTEAAVGAAVLGVGFTRVMQYQAAEAVAARALRIVLEAYEPAPLPVHVVHAAPGSMPLRLRRFLDRAVPRLRDVLAAA